MTTFWRWFVYVDVETSDTMVDKTTELFKCGTYIKNQIK